MSVRIDPGQKTVTYPPHAWTICPVQCAHYDHNVARKDAAAICPECGKPIGFGAEVPVNQGKGFLLDREDMTSYVGEGQPILIHSACFPTWQTKRSFDEDEEGDPDA